ncbi:type VII secretion target [Nocardia lijiangensis]|uniref:type VII secretion target n=1 Tax=Nocardia lijiangensis TaxID=299618 RepID=UPI00083778D4|nr:type VII secretion target [Nocardia lijiangensis]
MVDGAQPATQLQVNPQALQTFANNLGGEAGLIRGLNIGNGFNPAVSALQGTTFGNSAGRATDLTDQCLKRIADRIDKVAQSTRTAAGAYEVAEDDFAARLRTITLELP